MAFTVMRSGISEGKVNWGRERTCMTENVSREVSPGAPSNTHARFEGIRVF